MPEHQTEENSKELSDREREVLELVTKGYTSKDIASELNISLYTVQAHRKNISGKLGIKSVSALTVYAMMNGIVSY
ncbi:MAG: LuxR C-terminal-related transcriptional regulator [Candidatus Azobacteroides sp.]|nr:LuxR C-terminal-related transcriptional regulator [Candidatus Azobacteroides sp.]